MEDSCRMQDLFEDVEVIKKYAYPISTYINKGVPHSLYPFQFSDNLVIISLPNEKDQKRDHTPRYFYIPHFKGKVARA